MKKYLAVFIWHGDDGLVISDETDSDDKEVVAKLLTKRSGTNLDWAEILLIQNGRSGRLVGGSAPTVVKHWSALQGDFEDM